MLLVSNAVTLEREKSILYSRVTISGLLVTSLLTYNNLHVTGLSNGIGLYGGLFNITPFTQGFNLFILMIASFILILTGFLPRKVTLEELCSAINMIIQIDVKTRGFSSSTISIFTLLLVLFINTASE
jgi:hypothetical protein